MPQITNSEQLNSDTNGFRVVCDCIDLDQKQELQGRIAKEKIRQAKYKKNRNVIAGNPRKNYTHQIQKTNKLCSGDLFRKCSLGDSYFSLY